MGINIPTREELIANRPEFQDIAGYIGECLPFTTISIIALHVDNILYRCYRCTVLIAQ